MHTAFSLFGFQMQNQWQIEFHITSLTQWCSKHTRARNPDRRNLGGDMHHDQILPGGDDKVILKCGIS
jgi:hypothetical protein